MGQHSKEIVHQRLMDEMTQARCIREMAAMVILGQAGVEFDDDAFQTVVGNVAAVAEEYHASPDEVQAALGWHEPTLLWHS